MWDVGDSDVELAGDVLLFDDLKGADKLDWPSLFLLLLERLRQQYQINPA